MKRNVTEIEQRLLVMLKKNSRKSMLDAASELGVSRITAKKAFDSLVADGRIRSFTVTINEDMKDLVLVHARTLEGFPAEQLVESFRLIDGTYIAVMYYENLPKIRDLPILGVQIATDRTINENIGRVENVHCDYCQNELSGTQIVFEMHGKTYYACCPNCERDLKKRREFASEAQGA